MNRKIFKLFIIVMAASVIVSSCDDDDEGVPYTYNSLIDLKSTSIAEDQYTSMLLYSTDNGATFVDYPSLKVGETYKVKVHNTHSGEDLTSDQFAFDWSASDPAPADASLDMPDFTLSKDNTIKVKITNKHCPLDASSWTGDWHGFEDGACCGGTDDLTIEADPAVANRLIISNFWADGVDVKVYIDLIPSTSFFDQAVNMPEQETSEGGIAIGEGTYDQCAGTMSITTSYEIGGSTYEWVYELYR